MPDCDDCYQTEPATQTRTTRVLVDGKWRRYLISLCDRHAAEYDAERHLHEST
jgi:hypothetical protein